MNIAILGGGFTGLTAAYTLLQHGHTVTLFERGNSVGGLARGRAIAGTSLELTYHHIFRTDHDILRLANELGIMDTLMWRESSVGISYGGQMYPFRAPSDLLRFRPLSMVNRVRLGLILFYLQETRSWKKFTRISAEQWLTKMCGEKTYRVIWQPLLHGKFHHFASQISMAWLWARIHIRANSKEKGEVTEKLGYFRGGFATVIRALERDIRKAGGVIRLNEPAMKILEDEQHRVQLATNNATYTFDRLVATIPSSIFARLIQDDPRIPEGYLRKLMSIEYLGAVCMTIRMNVSLSPYYWMNIHDPSSPFLVCIEHTKLVPPEQYQGNHLYYLGTYVPHDHRFFTLSDKEIRGEFFAYLKTLFPRFKEENVLETRLTRLKHAQHVVDTSYEEKIPAYRTPLPHVFLSNFSQIFPEDRGTNYAVREGFHIAQILEEEKQ